MKTNWVKTGSLIQQMMHEKRISPIEMAGKIGCDMKTLFSYLDGSPITDTHLENMAAVLGTTKELLMQDGA